MCKNKIKNKSVIIINSLNCGGAEKVASILARDSQQVVYIFKIIPSVDYFNIGETKSINLGFYNGKIHPLKILSFLYAFLKLQKILWEIKPNVIISFLHLSHVFSYLTGLFNPKSRRVYSERSLIEREYTGFKLKLISYCIRCIFNNISSADSIISISRKVEESLSLVGVKLKNNSVIYNPIACYPINNYLQYIGSGDKLLRLFSVSRLHKTKNIAFLIECVSKINKNWGACNLNLIGDGPERKALEEMVKDLNLEDRVIFHGFVNEPFSVVRNADIFVYASEHESFGNVCLEAAANGYPVLLPDNSGAIEEAFSLSSESGVRFYKNKDHNSFINEIGQLSEINELKKCSSQLYEYSFLFNEELIIAKYEDIIFKGKV